MTKKNLITYKLRERTNDNKVENTIDTRIERHIFFLRAGNMKYHTILREKDHADSLSLHRTNLQATIDQINACEKVRWHC